MTTQEHPAAQVMESLMSTLEKGVKLPDFRVLIARMDPAARLALVEEMVRSVYRHPSPSRQAEALEMISCLSSSLSPQHRVEAAMSLARTAHQGQVDKLSEPYWKHLHAVAAAIPEDQHLARQVAWLHDSLEDTGVDLELIRALIGDEGARAVEAITHRPHEPRVDYYHRVLANPLAVLVKRADVAHNSNPDRLGQLDEKTRVRLERKYAQALAILG